MRCADVGHIHSSTSGGVALGLSGMSAMRPRSGSVATGFVDGLHDIAEADRDFDNRGFGACDIVSQRRRKEEHVCRLRLVPQGSVALHALVDAPNRSAPRTRATLDHESVTEPVSFSSQSLRQGGLLNSRRNREQAAMASDRTERAKQFLEQIMAQEESLEALHDDPHRLESVAERSTAQPEEIDAAKNAVEKIQMGHDLSPDEQFALEAIIIPDKRPAIDVVDGDYHVAHPLWTHFESDAGIHQRLRQVIPSIGRVELPGHPTIPYAGTGFVVGDELLMTNRHVAEIFADGLGTRAITFKPGYSSGIDFKQERNRPAKLFLKAIEVVMIHPYWDMALLRVAGLSPAQAPLVLSLRNRRNWSTMILRSSVIRV